MLPKFKTILQTTIFVERCSPLTDPATLQRLILRVYNDLLLAVDKGDEAVLILLDYSAAFDTINHNIFLECLVNRYGITGSALNLFTSYFKDRSQSIVINDSVSKKHTPLEGVLHGSVIGRKNFSSPIC